jgi:hypothetical protein
MHRQAALEALVVMCKHPQGVKVMRKDIWDIFLEASFFPIDRPLVECWKSIIGKIMSSERERLLELVCK